MSTAPVNQMDTKENLVKSLRNLIHDQKVSRNYVADGMQLHLRLHLMNNNDWDIILPEISNTERPLRELHISSYYPKSDLIGPGFIELAKHIANHTTLSTLHCDITRYTEDASTILFKGVKDNRSIKHLFVKTENFNSYIVETFVQTLMNNDKLLSVNLSVWHSFPENFRPPAPIATADAVEVICALQTIALQRFTMSHINDRALKALVEFLPNTLVVLDLSNNWITSNSIPNLRSYLESNGNTLKELILDDQLATDYFNEQSQSLSLLTVKIIKKSSWQARFARNELPLRIDLKEMSDADWSELFIKLREDNNYCRSIHLVFNNDVDRNQFNNIQTLLSNQFQLTSLKISGDRSDDTIQVELLRQIKANNSLNDLTFSFKMNSNVFNEVINLLAQKTDIIQLVLSDNPAIRDEEIIKLIQSLKNNTVLQKLTINGSEIGDTGFQALLSSLPNSLSELTMDNSHITGKSLPRLLDFITEHHALKYIHLEKTNIRITHPAEVDIIDIGEKIYDIADKNERDIYLTSQDKVTNAIINSTDNFINLYCKQLEDDDILVLYHGLLNKPTRNWSVNLEDNYKLTVTGCQHLTNILSSTINLVELQIGNNYIKEEGITIFLDGLSKNKTLKKFSLYSCPLTGTHMESLAYFIEKNPMLKIMALKTYDMDAEKITYVTKVLPTTSLEELDLSFCRLEDDGCKSVLSSIPTTLKKLSLAYNDIRERSLPIILSFLSTNQTLKQLTIRENPVFKNTTYWEDVNEAAKQHNICELN